MKIFPFFFILIDVILFIFIFRIVAKIRRRTNLLGRERGKGFEANKIIYNSGKG